MANACSLEEVHLLLRKLDFKNSEDGYHCVMQDSATALCGGEYNSIY